MDQILIQGRRIKTDQVRQARDGDGGLEPVGLRDHPVRHETAVAAPHDAKPVAVD